MRMDGWMDGLNSSCCCIGCNSKGFNFWYLLLAVPSNENIIPVTTQGVLNVHLEHGMLGKRDGERITDLN